MRMFNESFAIKSKFYGLSVRISVPAIKAFVRLLTSNYDHQRCDYNTILVRMRLKERARGEQVDYK